MWFSTAFMLSSLLFAFASDYPRIDIRSSSKVVIGGLFPIHRKGPNEIEPCGPILLEKGIQRLEAMLYAVDEINRNREQWNFNLGAIILDTCSFDSFALEQSLQFLHLDCNETSSRRKVTGIVGASNSVVSESVANIFRLFKIPQVSYASTSAELDDLHKYPYFFRVVPSDKFQVRAILDILAHFKWAYVSVVASKGDYGENAMKSLLDLAPNITVIDICFAEVHLLPRIPKEEDFDVAVQKLMRHENAKVVIVFLNEDKVRHLLAATRRSGASKDRFLWLGSDGWGAKGNPVRGNEEFADGAITLLPKIFPIKAGFDEYFQSLKPATNTRNPWFREFWEKQFNCSLNGREESLARCTGKESLKNVYEQEGLVPMVIDSVWLFATAIKLLCEKEPELCSSEDYKDVNFRSLLKKYIIKANFISSQGHGMVIKFDSDRSIPAHYKIYQYQRINETKFSYKEIGEWSRENTTRLKIEEKIFWKSEDSVPLSTCSEECNMGEERIPSMNLKKRCCWTCRLCDDDEYLPDVLGRCTPCPSGHIANVHHTFCIELELNYSGRDLSSPWAMVPFSFAIIGLLSTLFVSIVFYWHHKTPLIMAAGRELCCVILVGVALCYCFTFVVIQKPSKRSCGIIRTSMGLGLAICYAAIFTKTNRISRIFNRSIKIAKRPSYITPRSQLIICSCLILIQVILTAMWLIVTPPTVTYKMLQNPHDYVATCGFDGTSVILGLFYNMVLILLCTYYAYKTRNIPENFNESKFISFTMYASCIVWLAFVPIYFSAWQDYKVQSTVLCMAVSVSGSATLACLFLPKIYIVLFHPEKNVRYPNSTPTSSTMTINVSPVRFLRSNQNLLAPQQRSPHKNSESTDDNFLSVNQSTTSLNSTE